MQPEEYAFRRLFSLFYPPEEIFYYMYGMDTVNYTSYQQNVIKNEMIMYAIFDAEGLTYTEEEYNKLLAEIASSNSTDNKVMTTENVKEEYKNWQLETMMMNKVVMQFIKDKAMIK